MKTGHFSNSVMSGLYGGLIQSCLGHSKELPLSGADLETLPARRQGLNSHLMHYLGQVIMLINFSLPECQESTWT